MKKIWEIISSSKTTIVLLLAFAVSIAAATIIEERYDTVTARLWIYEAKWFEAVLLLLAVNFFGNIKKYQLLSKKKIASFLLHFAFVVMMIGAAVTRYFGFEGAMPIREGTHTNIFYSSEPYLLIKIHDNYYYNEKEYFTERLNKNFNINMKTHEMGNIKIVRKNFVKSNNEGMDALTFDIISEKEKTEFTLWCKADAIASFQETKGISVAYGLKPVELPFSLQLDDFILERYPGSSSPSSFESAVTLIDERKSIRQNFRIFMNNVLDYDGYRFFQSSYDADERGTILSVNHDIYGTWITYLSYILLSAGLFFTLLNKNMRFAALFKIVSALQAKRKNILLFWLLLPVAVVAKTPHINREHAEKLGYVTVQGHDGRFQPVHTLAYDVLHKISRKDKFEISGEKTDAMHVFADMLVNPEYWKEQKIVYIREAFVRDALGIKENSASFNDFFDSQNRYKLQEFVETAFRKKQSEQNKFDKEIIKLDERLNIMLMAMQGELLKIFPGQENHRWLNWKDPASNNPLEGSVNILNEDMMLPIFNYSNIFRLYFTELLYSLNTGDYSKPEKILGHIENIQNSSASAKFLPTSKSKKLEIQYNKTDIFGKLKSAYGVLSILLLVFVFIENLKTARNKVTAWLLNFFVLLTIVCFVFHTCGLGFRWYLSGHAPWSNGYETLLMIAWSALLAGFCFLKYSRIAVAATALFAFFALMTSGHSSYDPQLTNLQPVLKSYWLIFHVAALSISYGFFGLGFILGAITLIFSLFINAKNYQRNHLLIKEWTYINEMNLLLGLATAAIGTFLGAVWANESWGRYWGWDAKETWALVIIIVYVLILHLKFIPKLKSEYVFNVAAVAGFSSVLMTFFGVNYYLSKGLHSYASGDTPVFPVWAWIAIGLIIMLFIYAGKKASKFYLYEKENEIKN